MKTLKTASTLLLFSLSTAASALAVVDDHFDDNVLSADWTIENSNSSGFSYTESGTTLTVNDVFSTVNYTSSGGTWSITTLNQTFSALSDFSLEFDYGWDSEGSYKALQNVYVTLYDINDAILFRGGHNDGWVAQSGRTIAGIGGAGSYLGAAGSDPLTGTAQLDVNRTGNLISVSQNGSNIFSGLNSELIDQVSIEFWHYQYSGPGGPSFFGSGSVDKINLSGTAANVPEASAFSVFATGIFGLLLAGRRRKLS